MTSPEFFSERAYHAKVKSPFEVVVSAARALGAAPDPTPRTAQAVAYLGEPIFGHRDPNGWPETGESWMNTGAILNRINFGQAVAASRLPGAALTTWPGADTLSRESRAVQVDAVISSILEGAASPDTRRILMSGEHPFAEQAARQASTQARNPTDGNDGVTSMNNVSAADASDARIPGGSPMRRRDDAAGRGPGRNPMVGPPPQLTGLAQVVGLAIGSPEFQRR